MAKKAVNHPPAPVVESPIDPGLGEDKCDELKTKYGLNVDTYANHEEPKSRTNQSHHILQDKAMPDYLTKAEGLCVLLANSCSDTPHRATTSRQNERMNNKGKAGTTQPAATFGELKKLSTEDLTESFKTAGVPDDEAKALAECLVAEAEKHAKKEAKKKGKSLNDNSPVQPPGGCLPGETTVWLDDQRRQSVARLRRGARIVGLDGTYTVQRRDRCLSPLVRLRLPAGEVSLAPFHRVLLEDGRYATAASVRRGQHVRTASGVQVVVDRRADPGHVVIFSVSANRGFACRVGDPGLWIEWPHSGAPVRGRIRLRPFPVLAGVPAACTALDSR